MARTTVVVVDDEANIADLVEMYLAQADFRVVKATTGRQALDAIKEHSPDLVILDVGLPDFDGLEVCRQVRVSSQVPIIFLTARDDEVDRVVGLELGADDYVTKPFSPRELVARIKAVLRRSEGGPPPEVIRIGAGDGRVEVDLGRREVRVDGGAVDVTTREFDLVRFLAERKGLALSRRQILDGAWEPGWYGDERTVDVHVAQVRKKLGDAARIATVRGVGYRLEDS